MKLHRFYKLKNKKINNFRLISLTLGFHLNNALILHLSYNNRDAQRS